MRRRLLVALVVLGSAASLAVASPASAADPDAPPGAPASWLPDTPWVLDHWLPYDETRLYAILGVQRRDVMTWVRDESHTLGDLARRQGADPRTLPRRLVGPRGTRSPALYRELLRRAGKTLSQPHLSHHMWGHLFHVGALIHAEPTIFRMPLHTLTGYRAQGLSYSEIARRGGRAPAAVRTDILRTLRGTMQTAVADGATPRAQANRWFARQQAQIDHWMAFAPHGGRPLPGAHAAGRGAAAQAGRAGGGSESGAVRTTLLFCPLQD